MHAIIDTAFTICLTIPKSMFISVFKGHMSESEAFDVFDLKKKKLHEKVQLFTRSE